MWVFFYIIWMNQTVLHHFPWISSSGPSEITPPTPRCPKPAWVPRRRKCPLEKPHKDSKPFHVGTFIWRYFTVKTVIVWLFVTTDAKYNCSHECQYKTMSWIWSLKTCEGWHSTSWATGNYLLSALHAMLTFSWEREPLVWSLVSRRACVWSDVDKGLRGLGQRSCWDAQRRRWAEKVHRKFDYTGGIFKCPSMWLEINQNRRIVPNPLRWHVTALSVHAAAAAAAAKSLQSCLTLCDPLDGSPPGFPVPGILQARTLEWVAISFSNAWKWKIKVKSLSSARLLVTPWTTAHQAPPSMGFSRQEYTNYK